MLFLSSKSSIIAAIVVLKHPPLAVTKVRRAGAVLHSLGEEIKPHRRKVTGSPDGKSTKQTQIWEVQHYKMCLNIVLGLHTDVKLPQAVSQNTIKRFSGGCRKSTQQRAKRAGRSAPAAVKEITQQGAGELCLQPPCWNNSIYTCQLG